MTPIYVACHTAVTQTGGAGVRYFGRFILPAITATVRSDLLCENEDHSEHRLSGRRFECTMRLSVISPTNSTSRQPAIGMICVYFKTVIVLLENGRCDCYNDHRVKQKDELI